MQAFHNLQEARGGGTRLQVWRIKVACAALVLDHQIAGAAPPDKNNLQGTTTRRS
jgi:hypothetical protein